MHLLVGHLPQDSTFDLFEFLSKFSFQNSSFQTQGGLICQCGLYTGAYGNFVVEATELLILTKN